MTLKEYLAVTNKPGARDLILVGDRYIARWRVDERPDKTIPICANDAHKVHWTTLDGEPAEPGEGMILRCRVCGLDCT